jgi:hypothetical protein
MKTILSLCLLALSSLAAFADLVAISTTTLTINNKSVTESIAPAQTSPYYRLCYDSTGKVRDLIYDKGTTRTILSLYCATTYAEIQAYATANSLTGLPKQAPGQP